MALKCLTIDCQHESINDLSYLLRFLKKPNFEGVIDLVTDWVKTKNLIVSMTYITFYHSAKSQRLKVQLGHPNKYIMIMTIEYIFYRMAI